MYPRKGCIEEGADADLVIWNPNYRRTLSAESQLYNIDYSPYEGIKVRGMAEMVFLRGMFVSDRGEVIRENTGCYIARGKGQLT